MPTFSSLQGFKNLSKKDEYQAMCDMASKCTDCPNVFHKLTYLNQNNGNINSPIMFIGEAPGFVRKPENRLKAFYGNQSGWNFEYLLHSINIRRMDVFVTNALLHTPIKSSEKKYDDDYGYLQIRPPAGYEITRCGNFLRSQVDLVDPQIICTLGRAALHACQTVLFGFPKIGLWESVATSIKWKDKTIFPLYHTSPNVTASFRSLKKMEEDFRGLRDLMTELNIVLQ